MLCRAFPFDKATVFMCMDVINIEVCIFDYTSEKSYVNKGCSKFFHVERTSSPKICSPNFSEPYVYL